MSTIKVPDGYQRVMPYLILNDAAKFFPFMQTVFGATEKMKHMRNDTNIMHGEISIDELVIMYAGATSEYAPSTGGFFIYVENADRSYETAIKAGGEVVSQLADQDYGRSGGVKDPCGNVWWITQAK